MWRARSGTCYAVPERVLHICAGLERRPGQGDSRERTQRRHWVPGTDGHGLARRPDHRRWLDTRPGGLESRLPRQAFLGRRHRARPVRPDLRRRQRRGGRDGTGPASLACRGTLEAAGHVKPIEFTAHVEDASARAVTLRAEAVVDRTEFAMTWSPLGMASAMARVTVEARFARP